MTGKLILVTGGAGFIGSHLCERLAREGCRVISLDNYSNGSRANHILGVEYREGHTKDVTTLVPEVPDIVFHLGEYARVEQSLSEPSKVWDFNVMGTQAVLEFCRSRMAKIVYAGSSTKFADGGLGRDQSPYAFSKAMNTELVRNYGDWYGVSYAITYFYNVYGPREVAEGQYATVIAKFVHLYRTGKALPVTSPGSQRRIFTHVDDIVDGLMLVGEKGKGDEFGLGAEESYSILEIAELFGSLVEMLPERMGNRMSAKLDATKSHALGWRARRGVAEYIKAVKG